MTTYATDPRKRRRGPVAEERVRSRSAGTAGGVVVDNRQSASTHARLQDVSADAARAKALGAAQRMASAVPRVQRPTQPRRGSYALQRVLWNEEKGEARSSHKPDTVLNGPERGGVISITSTGGLLGHRSIVLEWFDGIQGQGREYMAHLRTPALEERTGFQKVMVQLGSALPGLGLESEVGWLDWRQEFASKTEQTKAIDEPTKEAKRVLIETEANARTRYNYGVTGVVGDNCKTWAQRIYA